MGQQSARARSANDSTRSGLRAQVRGFGAASFSSDEILSLRKSVPAWAPEQTPHHFFKYSDEQTIVAVHALTNALQRCELDIAGQRAWGIITAPQFLGRVSGANIFRRFSTSGAPGVSPQTIPQHSLHSVSGAISVLLATSGPNVAVGGGPDALADGLLTATTLFDSSEAPGCWLICTAWNSEPLPNREGTPATPSHCSAFALALAPGSASAHQANEALGELSIAIDDHSADHPTPPDVATIAAAMLSAASPTKLEFNWSLAWGGTARLAISTTASHTVSIA